MDRTHSAQTIRQPAYAEFLIDSMDRYPNGFPDSMDQITTSSKWTTQVGGRTNQYALNGYFNRLAVTQIQFQWNLPCIIQGYNDEIVVTVTTGVDAGTQSLTITPNYYTPQDLATELENNLQVAFPGSGFTVSYSTFIGGFTINAGEDFFFEAATNNLQRRTYTTFGFTAVGNPTADSYIGSVPTMLATRYIDIISAYLAKFQDVKDGSTSQTINWQNKIARVFPVPPYTRSEITETTSPCANPFIVTMEFSTPKQIMWSPDEALNNFQLELRDEFGDYVPYFIGTPGFAGAPVTYGCEYVMTLYASET